MENKEDIREFIEILRDGFGITPFIAREVELFLNESEKQETA